MRSGQFRIRHLLVATFTIACIFAAGRLTDGVALVAVFSLIYGTIPVFAYALSRYGTSRRSRWAIVVSVVVAGMLIGVLPTAVWNENPATTVPGMMVGSLCFWLPQAALISIWRSGLRSAGVDPDAY